MGIIQKAFKRESAKTCLVSFFRKLKIDCAIRARLYRQSKEQIDLGPGPYKYNIEQNSKKAEEIW